MKASELVARIQELIKEQGDINVFFSDSFTTGEQSDIEVYETITDDPAEREKLGDKYLHISGNGNW